MNESDSKKSAGLHFDTLAVRAGTTRTAFGEHADAMFLTSSFVHDSAGHAAAKFAGEADGYIYSRFGNPTVRLLEERLAALEGGEECRATASGMSAIMSVMVSLTGTGDHIICSRGVFGTTIQLFALFARYGIQTTYVPLADPDAWAAAVRPNTRMMFLETPSNPLTEVGDLRAISAIARKHGIALVVDNCFCTPALQRPLEFGADIVIHSATKHLDGQGRIIGGAVVGSRQYVNETLQPVVRYCGPTMSAFNAWLIAKGLETLSVRMERHSANALALARWLEAQPGVTRVYYPWLESHPQHQLARAQQSAGGAVVAFEVEGGDDATRREKAWRVVDGCQLISITANLGDVRSTITHPASTTHGRMSPAARAEAGIGEGMLRVAVGLEDPADLCQDLARGMV
jgi:O-succinylhomoserine sulfhydrylase